MPAIASVPALARSVPRTGEVALPTSGAVGAWVLGCSLILYLGLKGGGYDVVVRNEIGVAVWWIVLLGAFAGVLPAQRLGRASWAVLGLLTALAVWTAVGVAWSESSERTVVESSRLAMYLGVFALGASVCSRDHLRPLVGGMATGIVAVATLAVLSRLHPAWLPDDADATGRLLPGARSRLAYPLNYWNGLAALVALGVPLVLVAAAGARSLLGRCAATAALPLLGLCWYLTLSRGGALAIAAGTVAFLALTPRRVSALVGLGLGGVGSAILIAGVAQRPALGDGLRSELARHEGDELLVLGLVVCAGVALLRLGVALAEDHGLTPTVRRPRRLVRSGVATLCVIGVAAAAVASDAPTVASERWETFKNPQVSTTVGENGTSARFASSSGNGRYQFWRSSVDAFETRPLSGVGAGTFEFWWARHATLPGFVRNAHSLYFETLAETGGVGLILLLALIGSVLAGGVRRLRRAARADGPLLAAALAACVAFCVSAAVDWVWQLAVLPAGFLLLAGAVLSARPAPAAGDAEGPPRLARVTFAAMAAAAIVALALPLAGVVAIRDSQAAADRRDLSAALASARTAARVQPYAGSPALQRALVLELDGRLAAASVAARTAGRREPTNWRPPYVLARIETRRGNVGGALRALRRARALNRGSSSMR